VPPILSLSIKAVRKPFRAAKSDAARPPEPDPMIVN
jgi:hypothetical protein